MTGENQPVAMAILRVGTIMCLNPVASHVFRPDRPSGEHSPRTTPQS
ncbi:hypothetical protein [Komagataeibacter diospyri]